MIGEPCLAALGFAADPVAHDEALVGVALALDDLEVIELAGEAAGDSGIGGDGLDANVELAQSGYLREIEAGPVGCTAGRAGRGDVVVGDGVDVEVEVLAQQGDAIGEVEGGEAGAGIVAAVLLGGSCVVEVEETLEEGVEGDGFVAGSCRR